MSLKLIKITDADTGELLFSEKVQDYQLQVLRPDSARITQIGQLSNGAISEKLWIKNNLYGHIARELIDRFDELQHIILSSVLFVEDIDWQPRAGTTKPWMAKTSKANEWLYNAWGYQYIIQSRRYFTEKMSEEQIIALIYHELRHIGLYDIRPHEIEDWSNMVATLGPEWNNTTEAIVNILGEEFLGWKTLKTPKQQMLFEDKVINLDKARKKRRDVKNGS